MTSAGQRRFLKTAVIVAAVLGGLAWLGSVIPDDLTSEGVNAMLYPWITGVLSLLCIPGWFFVWVAHNALKNQTRLNTEMVANALPDGSHLGDNRERRWDGSLDVHNRVDDWTLMFPAGSGREWLHLNTEQVTRLREAWRIAVAEAADKIYVCEFAPRP